MGKSFFVKSPETGACYCGKCGKRQLTDLYNMQKHAQICDPQFNGKDEVLVVEEGRSWGYRLESAPGVLTLSICAPFLNRIRGFKDSFSGMEWIPVFAAEFAAGTRNPNILRNDTGYDMEVLLSLIRAGRIIPISTVRDSEVIRQVFPCIDIYSLQMFAHIYKCKGFTANKPIKPATESWLFEKTPGSKEWKDLEKHLTPVPGKIPIYAAVYKHRNDLYILQVVLKRGQEKTVFLFTRGYCSCSCEVDLKIFRQQYYLVGNAMKAVEARARICITVCEFMFPGSLGSRRGSTSCERRRSLIRAMARSRCPETEAGSFRPRRSLTADCRVKRRGSWSSGAGLRGSGSIPEISQRSLMG